MSTWVYRTMYKRKYYVYLVKFVTNLGKTKFYCGHSYAPADRYKRHLAGYGAKCLKEAWEIREMSVIAKFDTKTEAIDYEKKVKKLPFTRKSMLFDYGTDPSEL